MPLELNVSNDCTALMEGWLISILVYEVVSANLVEEFIDYIRYGCALPHLPLWTSSLVFFLPSALIMPLEQSGKRST